MLGIDATRNPVELKERIGVQLQTAALYPNLTVAELIDLFGELLRSGAGRPTELIERARPRRARGSR